MTQNLLPSHGAARTLIDWLNVGPEGPLPWRLRLRLRWSSFWFESFWQKQAQTLNPSTPFETPLFVMGFWRSGTTLLHNLLYTGYECQTPLAWQCFSPATFTHQRPPVADVTAKRPMDDGVVHSLGPLEDEFALLLLGEPSLYRGLLDPGRLLQVAEPIFRESAPLPPRWLSFLKLVSGDSKAPLLLKSPNHAFRYQGIAQTWPRFRSVWLHRPFEDVLNSNLSMWQAMAAVYRVRSGDADLSTFLFHAARTYRDIAESALRDSRILWIDYFDLLADPVKVSAGAACFLGLRRRNLPLATADIRVRSSSLHPQQHPLDERLVSIAREVDAVHARLAER